MSFRPEPGMRRVLIACTAMSLLGVLSALLDYSLAHGAFRSFVQDGVKRDFARLASLLLSRDEEAIATLPAEADMNPDLAEMAEDETGPVPHLLTASMTPLAALQETEELQEINRDLKADRMITEVVVPKLILPEPEPIGEGASAALFLLSPGMAAFEETPAPAVVASAESHTIVAGPVASSLSASVELPVRPPATKMFVTSAAAAAAAASTPTPSKVSWNELVRMASMKGGDGEEPNRPFGALSEKEFRARELRCMATAIYFEARGETVRGQIAVGQVIMNRVRSDFYPNTICGVVFQGQWNRNACQFSFACDGVADVPKEKEEWATALDVAKQVVSGKVYLNDIADATHYHAVYVRPDWRREVKRIKQIGVHIFYKAPFVHPLASNPDYSAM